VAFLGLGLALTLPFYLLGQSPVQVLPGLPLSALMAVVPAAAALLVAQDRRALLGRLLDAARLRGHAAPAAAILLMPAIAVAVYALHRLAGDRLPDMQVPLWAPFLMLAVFLFSAALEELGWTAFLLRPLETRWGALVASLVIGGLWAVWHLIPFIQGGRSGEWIAWQCAKTVAMRVVMVWLYVNTGRCLLAVVLFHAVDNLSSFLFPAWGSHYDPRLTAILLIVFALAAIVRSDPRTLRSR
jgi:membrane protease YdiL (CAAX protease family)